MAGSHTRGEIDLERPTTRMAGGSDLAELTHELGGDRGTDRDLPTDPPDLTSPDHLA